MSTQTEQLGRVSERIGNAIVEFCAGVEEFHADDLRKHVIDRCGIVAPGSADRVLRDLRQRGAIDYVCISRSRSLYRISRPVTHTVYE
jgi:hypothetical protein